MAGDEHEPKRLPSDIVRAHSTMYDVFGTEDEGEIASIAWETMR